MDGRVIMTTPCSGQLRKSTYLRLVISTGKLGADVLVLFKHIYVLQYPYQTCSIGNPPMYSGSYLRSAYIIV